ncbi:hypothetical protein Hypma_014818 [Hypsizygus marmoreus]|uniref:Uncharacterized protein n=1 Tax=Hypsizygus marmoreus TaxID=39966 RepID=A0A369K4A4_HYPMA|nr:hypothetical protein Hypma_014818 [Hypsizygus marmoreus]
MERWHTGYCKIRVLSHCNRQVASSPPSQQVEDVHREYGIFLLGVLVTAFASPFSPLALEAGVDLGRALPARGHCQCQHTLGCLYVCDTQTNECYCRTLIVIYLLEVCIAGDSNSPPHDRDCSPHWSIVDRPCNTGPTVLRRDGQNVAVDAKSNPIVLVPI